jgi:hypothetical protein
MTQCEYDDSITPPDRLDNFWRAVIEQHLRDAVSTGTSGPERLNRIAAREWFAERGDNYRYIAELAGFDPEDLATRALTLFAQRDKSVNGPKRVEYQGQSKTLSEWAKHFSIREALLRSRLKNGWPMESAINTPSRRSSTKQAPGVGGDFQERVGTGAGSDAQDRT